MQVSYGKLTVNDDGVTGALPHTIGRCHVALHGGTRRILAAGKKSLLYDPRISCSPNF